MSGGRRPPGQHDLRPHVARNLVAACPLRPGELVIDLGAGTGALTIPLAERGCRVLAVELDPQRFSVLRERLAPFPNARVVRADIGAFRWPTRPFSVVANPPFAGTWWLLKRLLDQPQRVPLSYAQLVLQSGTVAEMTAPRPRHRDVYRWSRWFVLAGGPPVPRRAFRPPPGVDARVVTIVRR